ncbi:alpha-tocopherol transfer protein-like [Anabrus simplex]|uniref:alpha-tocopherol transfer protein-like n=1 Tax=Anabrus simplex TaxID=316456 RepID=UPI0035A29EDA
MTLQRPSPKNTEALYEEFQVNRQSIDEAVEKLRQWLRSQPHLPEMNDGRRLERVLTTCKFSIVRAQQCLDQYFSLRNLLPEILRDRDPLGESLQAAIDVLTFVPLPRLTPDGYRVSVFKMAPVPANTVEPLQLCKAALMISEIRLAEDTSLGDILLLDMEGLSIAHLVRFTVPIMRKLELCATSAFNVRVSAMHFVNAPNFVDKLLAVVRTVLKPKVAARIHVHGREAGLSSLHERIPIAVLPTEYGGESGPLQDLKAAWKVKLESYRDWFVEQEEVRSNESLRPGATINSSDLLGFEGSFRQLSVD